MDKYRFGKKSMDDFYVYGHYKLNEDIPFYIGKGRMKRAYAKSKRGSHWKNIVNKYGYRIEIMYDNLSELQAIDLEIQFIRRYGRIDLKCGTLVNKTDGGEGVSGYKHTDEELTKMRETHLGKKFTEEHKKKISEKSKLQKWSNESKLKISVANSKRVWTKEARENLSKSKKKEWAVRKGRSQ